MTSFRIDPKRFHPSIFLHSLACFLLLALSSEIVAQELTVPTATDSYSQTDDLPFEGGFSFGEETPPVVESTMADSGMWFVRTHRSPQSFRQGAPRFCPEVTRYEDCVGYRRSSFSELCAGLEPGVPVCIFVHGSFVDTPSACREAVCTWRWLKRSAMGGRMQMIYVNWPSYRRLTVMAALDVNQLGRRASRNGFYLAEILHHVPHECPVCLIGHSHGTRVISSGLHLMAGGNVQSYRHPYSRAAGRQIRTVFVASAIDHNWLNPGSRYGRALCSTQCLLNMKNCRDPALAVYPLRLPLLVRRPMGLTGLSPGDRRQLGPAARKVVEYDVARVVGASHIWPYYFKNPGLSMAMRNYVYFPDIMPEAAIARMDRNQPLR